VLWNLSPPSQTSIAATDDSTTAITSPRFFAPVVLFTFLSLSRIGHIAIQLMVQELGQVEIPASQRSSFAGSEQSFHSMGELCHWAMTIVWSHPSEFCWLALGSLVVVGVSMVVYGVWARRPVEGKEQEYRGIALVSIAEEDEEDVMFVNH
jgi:iron-regulated transporter 1